MLHCQPQETETLGLTQGLGRLAVHARNLPLAPAAVTAAKRAFIDTIGVALAGWQAPVAIHIAALCPDGAEARALMGGRRLSSMNAAWLNGAAGHVLDYDDVALCGHPSAVLIPAILAEAQRLGAGGADAISAYLAGFEAWAELALREPDSYHQGSWHPTAMLGTVAAAVAIAVLNRLDEGRAANAVAIAASMASGVIANFGSHTKALQVGRAAANAIAAVRCAGAGLTGSGDALEAAHGFLLGLSPQGRTDVASALRLPQHAEDWRLLSHGLSVKRYPVCYAAHRAIDGVITLVTEAGLRPQDVASVTVSMAKVPAETLRFERPQTGLQAKFSLHHNVAAALIDRAVGFAQLTDDYVVRPDVAALYPLTHVELIAGDCPEERGMARHDRVVITTRDGGRLDSGPIRHASGHARRPLGDDALAAKFLDCARHAGADKGPGLLDRLLRLDRLATLAEIAA